MTRLFFFSLVFLLFSTPSEAEEYKPSPQWNTHFQKDKCWLSREFRHKNKEMVLLIESGVTLNQGKITLVQNEPTKRLPRTKAAIHLGSYQYPDEYRASAFPSTQKGQSILQIFGVDLIPFHRAEKEDQLKISIRKMSPYILDAEGLSQVIKEHQNCQYKLLESYGFDISSIANLRSLPIPDTNVLRWFGADDYPTEALRGNRQGDVVFQLDVSSAGKAKRCLILSSSGHRDLDKAVCTKVKTRSKFKPAIDNEGQPTSGPWFSNVSFSIPGQ